MPNARPTPGLRLTPETRELLRGMTEAVENGTAPFITHEAVLAARAFREIERLEAALAEDERWKQQYEEMRAGVERVVQALHKRARATARDWQLSGHPYHDGASDAYYEAVMMVRQLLAEVGGSSQ